MRPAIFVAMLMWLPWVIGCSQSHATREIPWEPQKPLSLAKAELFPAAYRQAVHDVAAFLTKNGENPKEFYADVQQQNDLLVFHLWHESAFAPENRHVMGNPGGKCRDVLYDSKKHRVVRSLFWQ